MSEGHPDYKHRCDEPRPAAIDTIRSLDPFTACLAIARGEPDPRARSVAANVLEAALRRHRLLGRAEAYRGSFSSAQQQVLAPIWREGVAKALAQIVEIERVTKILDAEKIEHFFFKGVVLQEKLTGSPIGRDSVDLDLKVPSHEFRRVVRTLLEAGYGLPDGIHPEVLAGLLPTELPLIHRKTRVELDIHRGFFAPFYSLSEAELSLEGLSQGRGFCALGTAFFALLSGAKDGWPSLGRVLDFHLALQHTYLPPLEHLCHITKTSGILEVGLGLDRHLFLEEPLPARCRPYLQQLQTDEWSRLTRHYRFIQSREAPLNKLKALVAITTHTSFKDLQYQLQGRPFQRLIRLIRAHGLDGAQGES